MQEANAGSDEITLRGFDQFSTAFSDAADELNALVSDAGDQALALRESLLLGAGQARESDSSMDNDASEPKVAAPLDETQAIAALKSGATKFAQLADSLKAKVGDLLAAAPQLKNAKARSSLEKWKAKTREYLAHLPAASQQLREPSRLSSLGSRRPDTHTVAVGQKPGGRRAAHVRICRIQRASGQAGSGQRSTGRPLASSTRTGARRRPTGQSSRAESVAYIGSADRGRHAE